MGQDPGRQLFESSHCFFHRLKEEHHHDWLACPILKELDFEIHPPPHKCCPSGGYDTDEGSSDHDKCRDGGGGGDESGTDRSGQGPGGGSPTISLIRTSLVAVALLVVPAKPVLGRRRTSWARTPLVPNPTCNCTRSPLPLLVWSKAAALRFAAGRHGMRWWSVGRRIILPRWLQMIPCQDTACPLLALVSSLPCQISLPWIMITLGAGMHPQDTVTPCGWLAIPL